MTKQEIINHAFYQLPDLDESYIEVLEDMHSAIIDKACKWIDDLMFAGGYDAYDRQENIKCFRKAMVE